MTRCGVSVRAMAVVHCEATKRGEAARVLGLLGGLDARSRLRSSCIAATFCIGGTMVGRRLGVCALVRNDLDAGDAGASKAEEQVSLW
jgi:hypothetical protein